MIAGYSAEDTPMAWVEVEREEGPWVLFVGAAALVFIAVVWWYRDFWMGSFAYLGALFVFVLVRDAWLQVLLPRDARRAANVVLAWFRQWFPGERVESVAVRAVEADRYVIAVRYGFGLPTPRSYFAVARPGLAEIAELPFEEWWPRGSK